MKRRAVMRPSAPALRRGWALVDVIVGGVILGVGLATIISLAGRSLAMQQRAEREAIAAQVLDGLLNEVLAVGPVDWAATRAANGRCDSPFDDWEWSVEIVRQGLGDPYRVVVMVHDDSDREFTIETLMAPRLLDEEEPARAPETPIDRERRYEAILQQ